jgi:hypothetical protein
MRVKGIIFNIEQQQDLSTCMNVLVSTSVFIAVEPYPDNETVLYVKEEAYNQLEALYLDNPDNRQFAIRAVITTL